MDLDAFAIFAFIALWCLATLALSALPIFAAVKRRAWRTLTIVVTTILAAHVLFFWWSWGYTIKESEFWAGAFLYLIAAPALPIFLWRFVRIAAEEPKLSV